jgi:hypothetical protein
MNVRVDFCCKKRGQSIVELIMITPLLLAALYVAMDFGVLYFLGRNTRKTPCAKALEIGAILPDCSVSSGACVTTVATQGCPGSAAVVQEVCEPAARPSY